MDATKRKHKNESESQCQIVLPYADGASERVARLIQKNRVHVSVRPVKTRGLLEHPKDK